MSTIIKRLKDKLGNFVLPITNTKAVYDDDGNRLDNTLTRIQNGVLYNESSTLIRNENDARVTNISGSEFRPIFASEFILPDGKTFATKNTISDAYNPSTTYSTGQYCIYNNTLWKSRVDNNIGNIPPNETYWTATSVGKNLITTNGEGTYGYLGADDSFVPFKNRGVLLNISPDIIQFDGAVYGENGRCNITGAFTYIRTQTSSSTSQEQTGFIRLGSFVDLTPYKKMKIKYVVSDCYYRGSKREKGQPTTSFYVMFALTTNKSQTNVTPSSYPCGDWLVNDNATLAGIEYEKEFDISSLEGMYYVISYIRNAHSVGGSQMPHLLYLYMESIELV